jgi:hypothetical protein
MSNRAYARTTKLQAALLVQAEGGQSTLLQKN